MNKLLKNREEELRENNYYQDKPVMSIDDHVSLGKQTTLALLESMVERLEGMSNDVFGSYEEFARQGFNRCKQRELDYLKTQITEIKL